MDSGNAEKIKVERLLMRKILGEGLINELSTLQLGINEGRDSLVIWKKKLAQ